MSWWQPPPRLVKRPSALQTSPSGTKSYLSVIYFLTLGFWFGLSIALGALVFFLTKGLLGNWSWIVLVAISGIGLVIGLIMGGAILKNLVTPKNNIPTI